MSSQTKRLKEYISNLIEHKSKEMSPNYSPFNNNLETFEKLLNKKLRCPESEALNLTKITSEDIILLQEYLEYLNMIGD